MNKKPANMFKKGNLGGPGRPALSEDLKAIKKATKEKLYSIFANFQGMNRKQIQELIPDEMSLLELGMMKSFKNFIKTGDYKVIQYPLDHIIGKAKESVDLNAIGNISLEANFDLERWKEEIKKKVLEVQDGIEPKQK